MLEEKKGSSFWDIVKFGLIVIAIVYPIRTFVAQPFIVSGDSMLPTFTNGEYLIIDELSYHFRTPVRGEVVVFRYPQDPSKFFIKRVIGLPGETVSVQNGRVSVVRNGLEVVLDEPYISRPGPINTSYDLGPGQYFVMGDNRPSSLDSRTWGPLDESLIKGRVLVRLLPITRAQVLPGTFPEINN
jgi:signal peptidase I